MDNIFKRTSAHWVRYDKYEWKESTDGVLYLTPAKDAVMSLYNPIKEYEELVLTALGIGLDVMQKKASMEELKQRILCTTFWTSWTDDRTSDHTGIYHL